MTAEEWGGYIVGQLYIPDPDQRAWLKRQIKAVAEDAVKESRDAQGKKNMAKFYFWKFVHNALIHPLMAFPIQEPKWLCFLHDWTAQRCQGAG